MNERNIYIDRIGEQTRVAVVEDGRLVEVAYETASRRSIVGNIYKGRVVNVLRGMNAAFVNIGGERNAFLSADDLPSIAKSADEPLEPITRQLRQGETLIVQVVKEPGGDKGPRLSCHITLAGRLVVLLPTLESVGVSRHIEDEETRARLTLYAREACPPGMGLIVRTAAENAGAEDFRAEAAELAAIWADILADSQQRTAPALLCEEGDLAARTVQDLYIEGKTNIIEGPSDDVLQSRIDKATDRRVWLQSGGFLVIDPCEAMTVIDVNTGKFTGKRSLADTILRLNCEAAVEIARQIRLRDMSGIVLIDFIDMDTEEAREKVMTVFREAVAPDRAKYRIHGFTSTGLLEMTRRPVFQSLNKSVQKPCPFCRGERFVKTESAWAHDVLRAVRRLREAGNESELTLRATPEVLGEIARAGVPAGLALIPDAAAAQPELSAAPARGGNA